MKNKKAALIILAAVLLVAVLVGIIIAATSSEKGPERLASPKNVRMEGTVLFWNAVENATEYVVCIENEERRTARLQYGLASLTEPGTYTIAVYAVGDGEAYLNSDPVEISYTVKNGGTNISNKEDVFDNKQPTEGLTYTLLEDSTG
ncbi:MAG: hypothetical protein IJF71_01365, partial [Clostridia bacterium]|nr:hypothetical protein [Clostridia bacterium]